MKMKNTPTLESVPRCERGGLPGLLEASLLFLVPRPTLEDLGAGMSAASRLMDPSKMLSNGTHEFKRTVLIVSIDGLR